MADFRSTGSADAIYRHKDLVVLYFYIRSTCSPYANGYLPSNMIVIDGSRDWADLQRKSLLTGFPTNTIITTKDMKIHYKQAGYSSSQETQIKAKLKSLLP